MSSSPSKERLSFGDVLQSLIGTAAVLVALFIFWQLVWTEWQGNASAQDVASIFYEEAQDPAQKIAPERRDAPPVVKKESLPGEDSGEAWAVVYLPTLDKKIPLAEGVGMHETFDKGLLGHYPHTQLPGELGNMVVGGHRITYGSPLKDVDSLREGDPIILQTKDTWYVYKVRSHEVVPPTAWEITYPVPHDETAEPTEMLLTLFTCHPPYVSNERWITYSAFDYWAPVDSGTPKELL